jgi:tetratricopeptide (TPR) repeat protein
MDNLDDFSVAESYLPYMKKGGHTLITTRNPDALNIPAIVLEIPVHDGDAATNFLLLRSQVNNTGRQSLEWHHAAEIVKELGYLPLAIEVASAFIRRSTDGISHFLPEYRKSRERILDKFTENDSHPMSIAASFHLSLEKIREMARIGEQAVKLLGLLVFLNSDAILIDFLRSGREGLSDNLREIIDDDVVFQDVLNLLQRFSLVTLSKNTDCIVIHRLIQAVMKDEFSEMERYNYMGEVIEISKVAFPETVTNETRGLCRRYQDQVLQPVLEAADIQSMSASSLLTRIGAFLGEDGKYDEAERLQKRVLHINESMLGPEHPDTLTSMSNLAVAYSNQGRVAEAEELEERVLEARRRVLWEEHPGTLSSMNNLAVTYSNQGRVAEAEELHKKVLEVRRLILGDDHPSTLSSMSNLAHTFSNQGRVAEAAELEEKVLEASRRILGEEHPDTLSSMNNLAVTYSNQGRVAEAAELEEKVLEASRRILGEEHPDTLSSMNKLTVMYNDLGRVIEAIDLRRKSLAGSARALGGAHLDTVNRKAWLNRLNW